MCQYINGLIVEVEQTAYAASEALQRPVAGQHVRIELKMLRHVAPMQQLHTLVSNSSLLFLRLLIDASSILNLDFLVPALPPVYITVWLQRLFPLLRSLTVYLLN